MLQRLFHNKGRILRYTLVVFLLLSLIFFGISLWIQHSANTVKGQELLRQDEVFLQSVGAVATSRLNRIVTDPMFIKDSLELTHQDADGQDPYEEILEEWIAFSNAKKVFDQIRFLDRDGNEILRVNYAQGGAYSVPQRDLQNKKDRYYFSDTIGLADNHVYISCMDLNIENGKIEIPYKPTIRLATPAFDSAGQAIGIVVLNYNANDLLSLIQNVATNSIGAFSMLNSDGYWFYNSEDPTKEWAFMFPDRLEERFQTQYPAEWAILRNDSQGTLRTENGAFIYARIFSTDAYGVSRSAYPVTLGTGDWYILARIPLSTEAGRLIQNTFGTLMTTTLAANMHIYGMILLIALVIGILMNLSKTEQETIKFFSEYDTMTGVLNRRAGLEKLSRQYIHNPDRRCQISICFMDINGLKQVNDNLGHEAGDELIRTVADVLRKTIRQQDMIARLGGDEFLVVFDGLDIAECEAVWQRITEGFEAVNRNENRNYQISVSHGIETYRCHSSEDIDTIIQSADAKMYEEKRQLKKNLHVIREGKDGQPAHSLLSD